MNKHFDIKKTALLSLFLAFAVILSYIDALLSPSILPIAGAKLGLSNLAVLLTLSLFSLKETVIVSHLRILIVHLLLFPSINGFLLSLCGATLSILAMAFFKKLSFPLFSTSILGSIAHNLGQVIAAVLLLKTPALFSCLIWLLPTGVFCGGVIGLLSELLTKRIKKTPYFKGRS